jgi:molecular chaperone GrpE (heat shock protein)
MGAGVGFRIKAEEARRRAERALDPMARRELQKLAAAYLDLADRADRGAVQQQQQKQPKTATEGGTEYRPEG